MKENYTITFTVEHDAKKLIDVSGIPPDGNPLELAFDIENEVKARGYLADRPFPMSEVLFTVLPKVSKTPEAYMMYFMFIGYQMWMKSVNETIKEMEASG
jgi:hypothetical protein